MDVNGMILLLEDMTKNYRFLLELVRKEKQVLIDARTDEMNASQLQKEILLQKISEQDLNRQIMAREISRKLGLNSDEPRLLEIAKHIDSIQGNKLRSQHAALELILKRLSEINKENASIAEMALKNVTFALDNLKETFMGQKTYQKKGRIQNGNDRSGHLISKEA